MARTIQVARNEFSILFADAQALLPQKPFEVGGVWSVPTVGIAAGHLRTYLSPLLYMEGEIGFDDALYAVLAQNVPLAPQSTYVLDARGESMAGFSVHCGWSAPLATDVRGNGLYGRIFVKYILGLGMSHATSELRMTTADTLLGDSSSLDVDYGSAVRTAELGHTGNGYGLDVGLGIRMGAVDFGVGVRDLGARVHWSRTFLCASQRFSFFHSNAYQNERASDPYPAMCPPFFIRRSAQPKSGKAGDGWEEKKNIIDITRNAGIHRNTFCITCLEGHPAGWEPAGCELHI